MGHKNEKLKGPEANSVEIKCLMPSNISNQPIISAATMHLDVVSPAPEIVNKPGDHGVRQCPDRPKQAVTCCSFAGR